MIKSALMVFLAAVIVFLIGCDEPEGQIGSQVGILPGGEAVTEVFYADMDTSFAVPPAQTGKSQHLYVGLAYGITSRALIKFNCPLLPYEWNVDSSYVEFVYQGGIGSEGNPEVCASRLSYIWTERDTIDLESLPDGVRLWVFTDLSQGDSGWVRTCPDVEGWMRTVDSMRIDTTLSDTAIVDSGLTILLSGGIGLTRFRSRSASEDTLSGNVKPRLFIYITARDSAEGELYPDTLEIIASDDMFLLEYDTAAVVNDLLIGSGAAYRSFIHYPFNLDQIDTTNYYVVVNRAVLTLHRKQIVELLPVTEAILSYTLHGDSLDIDSLRASELKSFIRSTPVVALSAEHEMVITSVVADWLLGKDTNYWLALLSGNEGYNIDRIAFHSAAGDTALDPRLTVYYTRFER